MNRRGWIVTVLVLALPGLAFWLAPGPPLERRSGAVAEAPWTLPAPPPADAVRSAYERLRARQSAAAGGQSAGKEGSAQTAPPLADGDWRLRGIVQVDGQRYALIETAAGKIQRYREGESLPRGERLRAVRWDRIEISRQEANETRVLYRGNRGDVGQP